jgi:radical SAM family uncharacterized protein/radical SAM-linked protein
MIAVESLLTPEINKPARYLGNERGAAHKDWASTNVRWALTYPEVYEVGSSNLGHIILYSIINAQPRQLCDRAYLPALDLASKLRETKTPLFGIESRRSLTEFDILGFSLSYELGATNILEMLDLAGIPLTAAERAQGQYPLIFAGGQTATSNPEPYADFFDLIVMGDGEELLPEIGLVLEEGKIASLDRTALLLDLAQIPGVYVPEFYAMQADGAVTPLRPDVPERILRRVATPIPAYSIGLVPFVETVHDRLVIEIRRGCTRGCRFCQPGMLTRPARDVEPEAVVEAIEKGMRATGYDEFSLLSLSCSDYLALPAVGVEIKNRLKDENISLSLPSQRVDRFDENIAHIVGGLRQGSLTFAPEAGTQRLRDIINKGLTNEELLNGIKTAWEQGWNKVKLYFMIGLPGETDEDVIGIADTIRWLQQECRGQGRRGINFNLTISNFTPKPHTPFQWHSVSTAEFKRKQLLLRNELSQFRGLKVNYTDVRISAMEDFVGRGDRRLAPVIKQAWELGAGMDSWWESLDKAFGAWQQAIENAGLSGQYRQVDSGEWGVQNEDILNSPLPWDHMDSGVDKQWLREDLARALAEAIVPDCSFDGCSHCGVCGTDFGHNVVVPPPAIPDFLGHFKPDTTKAQRLRLAFGKLGDMRFVGHLDLVRLFDRAVRRATLPVSFSGGFHPAPRIMIANALSLGYTSRGEIVEFELREKMDVEEFRSRLAAELNDDLPIYEVQEVPLATPLATQLLDRAEYCLTVATEEPMSSAQWQSLSTQILESTEILQTQTTKSGKVQEVNLRDRLFELELLSHLPTEAEFRYIGSCRNDGTMLRPEQMVYMLGQASGTAMALTAALRLRLICIDSRNITNVQDNISAS